MCQLFIAVNLSSKKYPYLERRLLTYQKLVCEEFVYGKKYQISAILITDSSPKIDKDLKTGF